MKSLRLTVAKYLGALDYHHLRTARAKACDSVFTGPFPCPELDGLPAYCPKPSPSVWPAKPPLCSPDPGFLELDCSVGRLKACFQYQHELGIRCFKKAYGKSEHCGRSLYLWFSIACFLLHLAGGHLSKAKTSECLNSPRAWAVSWVYPPPPCTLTPLSLLTLCSTRNSLPAISAKLTHPSFQDWHQHPSPGRLPRCPVSVPSHSASSCPAP